MIELTQKIIKTGVYLIIFTLTLLAGTAMAAPVSGGLGFWGTSANAIDGVDFGDQDGILDSDAALTNVLASTGDLALPVVSMNIFDFSLDQSYPTGGQLLSADSAGFSFEITTIALIDNGGSQLDYAGTGIISLTGFDDTLANWSYSSTGGATYTLAVTAVPLPAVGAMMYVLFAGLLGMTIRQRRTAA